MSHSSRVILKENVFLISISYANSSRLLSRKQNKLNVCVLSYFDQRTSQGLVPVLYKLQVNNLMLHFIQRISFQAIALSVEPPMNDII